MHSDDREFSPIMYKRLILSIIIVGLTLVAEVVGGILSNSLALLSDAGHVFSDLVALVLSCVAYKLAAKKSDVHKSYGYRRCQVIAAFVNGLSLFVVALMIVGAAIDRFIHPLEIHWKLMSVVAVIGFIANILVFLIMYRKDESNINLKSAVLHIVGDLLGSLAAIVSSLMIMVSGWQVIDPILSILVSVIMLRSAYQMIKTSCNILLESKPAGIDVEAVRQCIMKSFSSVQDVHHMHIWALTPSYTLMTMHVRVTDLAALGGSKGTGLVRKLKELLHTKFDIHHVTIEVESTECSDISSTDPSIVTTEQH